VRYDSYFQSANCFWRAIFVIRRAELCEIASRKTKGMGELPFAGAPDLARTQTREIMQRVSLASNG